MKSYDLLVLVVFIPEGRPQQRILLLGGRLAKLAGNLVRVCASLDGGRRFFRQFGSRENRPPAGGVIATSAAGGPAGGRVAAAVGATAQDGSVATGRARTAEALIRRRAYAASGDGLLLGAHDFVEVFQGLVEYTLSFGYAARRTGTAGAAAGPVALLASGAIGIAALAAVAGFLTTGLTRISALAATVLAAVLALTTGLGAVLSSTFLTLAACALTSRLTGIATLTVTGSVLATGLTRITALTITGSVLTSRLTRISALTVTGSILALGTALLTALLTARLTRSAVTLTTRLGSLRTAGREGRSATG